MITVKKHSVVSCESAPVLNQFYKAGSAGVGRKYVALFTSATSNWESIKVCDPHQVTHELEVRLLESVEGTIIGLLLSARSSNLIVSDLNVRLVGTPAGEMQQDLSFAGVYIYKDDNTVLVVPASPRLNQLMVPVNVR